MSGCRIQNNKFDSSLEKHSAVEQSPKKFKLDDTLEDSCEVVHFDDLGNVKLNQFVTVTGKVIILGVPICNFLSIAVLCK